MLDFVFLLGVAAWLLPQVQSGQMSIPTLGLILVVSAFAVSILRTFTHNAFSVARVTIAVGTLFWLSGGMGFRDGLMALLPLALILAGMLVTFRGLAGGSRSHRRE